MRLLKESDVIKAIDKHTKEDGTLNEDITVILEEVRTAFDREKVVKKLKRLETNSFGYYNQYDDEQAFGVSAAYRVAIEIVEKGEIDYPENRWIPSDCPIKPKDKELCTIILKSNDDPVRIVQYRDGLFYHIRDILWHDCIFEYFEIDEVSYWKPLDLPEDVNGSIQKEIDEVFEYET